MVIGTIFNYWGGFTAKQVILDWDLALKRVTNDPSSVGREWK